MLPSLKGKIRKQARVLGIAGATVVLAAIALVAPVGPARAFSLLEPAMTVAGGNSVIAVQTASDGLRFYWNEHGTNNWNGEQVAAAGTTFSAPAIAQVGNDVVIAAQGPFDSLDVYWQAIDATGWNSKLVAGISTTFSQPSIQADGTSGIIAAEGAGNSLDFYWTPSLTANWTPETVAGAGTTYSAPAEIVNENSVNIAAEGPSNSLDFYWAVNGTTTWGPEVVAGAGAGIKTAPAMIYTNGTVQIFASDLYVDLFGKVLSYSALDGTANWIPQEVPVGALNAPGGSGLPLRPGQPGRSAPGVERSRRLHGRHDRGRRQLGLAERQQHVPAGRAGRLRVLDRQPVGGHERRPAEHCQRRRQRRSDLLLAGQLRELPRGNGGHRRQPLTSRRALTAALRRVCSRTRRGSGSSGLASSAKVGGEIAGGVQGVGVVLAQDALAALQGVAV